MKPFRRLFRYLLPHWRKLALAAACLVAGTPAQLFHPLAWLFIVDQVVMAEHPRFIEYAGHSRGWLLLAVLGIMFVVHAIGAALGAMRTYLLGRVGQQFVLDLRVDVYRHIQQHSLAFFHRHTTGDLMARTMGDIDALEEVAIQGTDEIVSNAIQFFVVAGIIVWLQPVVGLITLIPLLGVGVMVRVFNKRVRGLYRQVRDRLGDVATKLQESLTGILIIKAFGREQRDAERFDEQNKLYFKTSLRAVIARSFYFPGVMTVGFMSNLAMIGLGGWFVIQGKFTVGGLVAYRGYWWQLFSPVNSLARINEMIQRAGAAASRVFELMDEPIEIADRDGAIELQNVQGAVTMRGVHFAYATRENTLSDISFHAEPGQSIGVVGPSGSGKSTLVSLLLRLYDPAQGEVLVDGQEVRGVTQASLRKHFAIVTQEPFLFNESIRANILYAHRDPASVTDEQLFDAARQANAHEFILALPEGYNTIVGERGVRLSGGQKQRISIARALLANPRILLLDEATASVEPESESIIQAAVQNVLQGRTAIIISHRLSMVRDCEQILVIEDGRITEAGPHSALMATDGWYARMYGLQMGHPTA